MATVAPARAPPPNTATIRGAASPTTSTSPRAAASKLPGIGAGDHVLTTGRQVARTRAAPRRLVFTVGFDFRMGRPSRIAGRFSGPPPAPGLSPRGRAASAGWPPPGVRRKVQRLDRRAFPRGATPAPPSPYPRLPHVASPRPR